MWAWHHRLRLRVPLHLTEKDLDDEVRFHIESRTAELVRTGLSPDEAERRARLEFGSPERVKEDCRDARFGRVTREFATNVRFATRQMRRDRGLSVTILATVTLAIGVTATVFSVVNAVVLDPLPYPDRDRLVVLWSTNARTGLGLDQARKISSSVTAGDFVLWRDQSGLFDGLAAVALSGGSHLGGATPLAFLDADPNAEPARVALVSPAFFEITGVRPRLGRTFSVGEPAVLLQHSYWRRRFEARESVIGQTVWQGYGEGAPWSRELHVAGVMPRDFAVISSAIDYLEPFDIDQRAAKAPQSRGFAVLARLKPGISLDAARQRADAFSRTLEQRNPDRPPGSRVQIIPIDEEAAGEFRPFMLALLAAVLLLVSVLAINTATLLLLKGVARAKELAVRSALGASPGRLARQLVTESTVLSAVGAVGGLVLASLLLAWLRANLPNAKTWGGSFLQAESLRVDAQSTLFAAAAALTVGAAFGLVPAWHSSRIDVGESLKDAGPSVTGGPRRRRMNSALLAAQFVLAAVLCTGSGLLVRSAAAIYRLGPGFDYGSRMVVGVRAGAGTLKRIIQASGRTPAEAEAAVSASDAAYWTARERFRRAVLERAAALPGVQSVTASTAPLMSGGYWLATFRAESAMHKGQDQRAEGLFTSVESNYFSELRIRILEGRVFSADHPAGAPPVVVISENLAQRLWPGRTAVGQRLSKEGRPRSPIYTVIGVVADTKMDGIDKPPVPQVYEPWSQNRWWHGSTTLILRSHGADSLTLVGPLRQALAEIDKDATMMRVHRVDDLVYDSAWRINYAAGLSAGLAGIALLLAAIGIYGVLSHSVRERTREIGLRMALGAGRAHLTMSVLQHPLRAVTIGTAAGLVVSAALVKSLRALLFGVEALDVTTFVVSGILLGTVATAAALIPLRRALNLHPLDALRHE